MKKKRCVMHPWCVVVGRGFRRPIRHLDFVVGINGLMYGNLLNISLCVGRETDFYVIGLGTEVDMHSMFASGVNIKVRLVRILVCGFVAQCAISKWCLELKSFSIQSRGTFCSTSYH